MKIGLPCKVALHIIDKWNINEMHLKLNENIFHFTIDEINQKL